MIASSIPERWLLYRLTSWVSVSEDELAVFANEGGRVPDGLEEKTDKANRIIRRAITSHHLTWICNVRSVVWAVEVFSIPATGEHEFGSNSIGTIGVQVSLIWKEMAVQRAFRSLGVVQAVHSNGGLAKETLGSHVTSPVRLGKIRDRIAEVTLVGIAREHLEARRESRDIGAASVGVQEIVSVKIECG